MELKDSTLSQLNENAYYGERQCIYKVMLRLNHENHGNLKFEFSWFFALIYGYKE